MSISRKVILIIFLSIFIIASVNLLGFFVLYSNLIPGYMKEKENIRTEVTLEYINQIQEKQVLDEVDRLFSLVQYEFFELFPKDNTTPISLEENNAREKIVKYLSEKGVDSKYLEEFLPTNNFEKVVESLKDETSPEGRFFKRFAYSLLVVNIFTLIFIAFITYLFSYKTLVPIRKMTKELEKFNLGENSPKFLDYTKKDEVGVLVNTLNDIAKKLKVQENIRSRLLADISHELKTPITSIQCYLEGISDGTLQLNNEILDYIIGDMTRLINLVNTIMDYEKFDNSDLKLNKENILIFKESEEIANSYKGLLVKTSQKIEINGNKNAEVLMDLELFKQLFHNVLGNFLKYAGKETSLFINISNNFINFSDNGNGVDIKDLPYLTEKFYQAKEEKTGDAESRGIGVGLSIVKKICEVHGFKLEIKSEKGKGFSIKIYFNN